MIAEIVTGAAVLANAVEVANGFGHGLDVSEKIKKKERIDPYGFDAIRYRDKLSLADLLNLAAVATWLTRVDYADLGEKLVGYAEVAGKFLQNNPELWCLIVPGLAAIALGLAMAFAVPELVIFGPLAVSIKARNFVVATAEEAGKLVGDGKKD